MKILKSFAIGIIMFSLSCNNSAIKETDTTKTTTVKPKVEVLLIGTSHWNNFNQKGSDIAQSNEIDILSESYQSQLSDITQKIVEFKPSKVFVERTIAYQPKLDSLYQLYRTSSWGKDKRNEIYQLGFRVANELNHTKVYGIDFRETSFDYEAAMKAMEVAGQEELISETEESIKIYEETYNEIVKNNTPLEDIIKYHNDVAQRQENLGWYFNVVNRGGNLDDFSGSYLASEWIRRNLHTYALIQKYVAAKDERIMILMGAGHTAVLHNLISYNPEWQIVSLDTLF